MSGRKIAVDNDPTTGHNGCGPTRVIASSNITLDGIRIVVEGDSIIPHCSHTGTMVGTSNITINGKRIILDGDHTTCNDTIIASGVASVM